MAHSALLSTYSGLLSLGWPIPHYGYEMESEVQEIFLCATTAARVSQYGGDLWMVLQTSIAAGEQLNIGGQLDDLAGEWWKKEILLAEEICFSKAQPREERAG